MPSSLQLHRTETVAPAVKPAAVAGTAMPLQKQVNTHRSAPISIAPDIIGDEPVPDYVLRYHTRVVGLNQCCSVIVQSIAAPVTTVWSVVRRFDNPQAYKHFIKSCQVIYGDGNVGSIREVHVISGLPAANSYERLEILDNENHVISFSVVGGDHRLANYRSVTTLHAAGDGSTFVVESYVVDVPSGNTKDETCMFTDTIVRCNLQSLAQVAEKIAADGKLARP